MANYLDGKVAIVTGAGRGIVAGVAKALAGEGAKVIVNDYKEVPINIEIVDKYITTYQENLSKLEKIEKKLLKFK